MESISITNLRKNLFAALENVIEYNDLLEVTTKKGDAIIISKEEYDSIMETIYIISQPGLLSKIKEGDNEKVEEMKTFDPNEEW